MSQSQSYPNPAEVRLPGECLAAIRNGSLSRGVLSRPRHDGSTDFHKTSIRPVAVQGESRLQFAHRIGNQETHENLSFEAAICRLEELLSGVYRNCQLQTSEADWILQVKSAGRLKAHPLPPSQAEPPAQQSHDRVKPYLIPEGTPCPFLIEMGVMTPAGKVKAAMYHKFRQINRFLELVDDIVPMLPATGKLHVVDFGCGKSYLTFALDYLLRDIRKRDVQIVGLDRNPSVIDTCQSLALKLGCPHLDFRVGDIAGHQAKQQVDLAVSLHACDTATDDALAQAVNWRTPVILAVPCCQRELAAKIESSPLASLTRYGILKERFASLATDALRAEVLEQLGYRTQIVEFIDLEHTPKNLMIRAVRRDEPNDASAGRGGDFRRFKDLLGIDAFHLECVLSAQLKSSPGA